MINHYLKQAFRNIQNARLITFGSILTIFLGVLSMSLLFSYLYNELSMDKFHHRHKDIYMMVIQGTPQSKWDIIRCSYFFNFNYKEYPEIEGLTSIKKYDKNEIKFTYNGSAYFPEGLVTDSIFFSVFDFRLKAGTVNSASNPQTVLITESFAKKVFGNEDPLGKTIILRAGFEDVFTVNGILENPPSNSSIKFDFIIQMKAAEGADFILVKSGFNKDEFLNKIEKTPQNQQEFQYPLGKLGLIPLDDIYFSEGQINLSLSNIFKRSGDKNNIKVLILILVILLLVSVLNFSNLQIVNINSSIKNIGINKIAGANGLNLFYLKFTEILLLTGLATFLITITFTAVLPLFNKLTEVALSPGIFYIVLLNMSIIGIMVLLAMIYPTILISRLPIKISLKNQLNTNNKLVGRQVIVIAQVSLSICLLIASAVVIKQLDMMLHKDLGFHAENIIKTKFIQTQPFPIHPTKESVKDYQKQWDKQKENFQFVMNEMSSNSSIMSYSQFQSPIEAYLQPWGIDNGTNEFKSHYTLQVAPTHLPLFDFKLVTGRFFDPAIDRERGPKVVINEAAQKYWGIEDISKVRLNNGYQKLDKGYEILGIVKDFNFRHLSVKPQPLILVYWENIATNVFVRFQYGELQNGLQFIQKLHTQITPGEPFKYTFLTDEISALYNQEKRLSQVYILFTLIAFFISMSGLFTIALYDTLQRTKEIGIRKINGANVSEILGLLNRDFIKWVAIAFLIACPISWYVMNQWLESFAYKTELSWWIFALSGLMALGIALLTVSYQSWKAATRNPVEALRYE